MINTTQDRIHQTVEEEDDIKEILCLIDVVKKHIDLP